MVNRKQKDLFHEAFNFAFGKVYHLWRKDLERIFSIGTKRDQLNQDGCKLATTILVIIGIESIARFFYYSDSSQMSINRFVNTYFHIFYKGKFKTIYELYRHGLAHYAYPKMCGKQSQVALIKQPVAYPKYVSDLEKIKDNIDGLRLMQKIDKKDVKYKLLPQVLFLDAIGAIEKFKKDLAEKEELKYTFIKNYIKVKKRLFQ